MATSIPSQSGSHGSQPNLIQSLPYDLIARVMEICREQNEYDVLFRCSLVNWEFNRAASRMLYSRVVLDPPFRGSVLNLRDVGAIPKSSNFDSACLPQNAGYVTALKISGYLSPRPPPRNTLPQKIADGLPTFVNLSCIELTPTTYHETMFDGIVPLLGSGTLQRLTELVVNASCTDEVHAPGLAGVGAGGGGGGGLRRLKKLTLVSPGRRILQLLPDWLDMLSGTLVELHLKNNCGSVTPGVLKSFMPFVKDTLEGFTFGLSYSLTNQDVFDFITQLRKLRRLDLQYYWAKQQLKSPKRLPSLVSLRSFSVTHPATYTRLEVDRLDKWVRWVIARSPDLETLCLRCESSSSSGVSMSTSMRGSSSSVTEYAVPEPAYVSHDTLVDHLTSKHWTRLNVLQFSTAFVKIDKLLVILETCTLLESLEIMVDRSALTLLSKRPSTLPFLRTMALRIANLPRRFFRADGGLFQLQVEAQVLQVMRNYRPSLCQLWVNGVKWEARWKVADEHHLTSELVVQKVIDAVPPWDRKSMLSSS